MWGGVGAGKTMMMDLFYDSVPPGIRKMRRHYHAFMLDIHQRLHRMRTAPGGLSGDPLPKLARSFVEREAQLLCLDEFQVTDIADAMLLKHLFSHLFDAGLTLVATSNRRPEDLYLGGINRDVFLPFISVLKDNCCIVRLEDGQDHRLLGTISVGVYHTPLGPQADAALDSVFRTLSADGQEGAEGKEVGPDVIEVSFGRTLNVPLASKGRVARFDFADLCTSAVGAADYIAIAKAYPAVIVANVPLMKYSERDRIRRFINMLDVFYEYHVRLVLSAAATPEKLFVPDDSSAPGKQQQQEGSGQSSGQGQGQPHNREDEQFASSRAVSRLIEMQTSEYLEASAEKRAKVLA